MAFYRVKNRCLKNAIMTLRPDANLLPIRKQLASSLLDKVHRDLVVNVENRLNRTTSCLISDAWSNIKNYSIVNYIAASPASTVFLESTGQQSHDSQFIAKDIARVMMSYPIPISPGL